MPLTPDDIQRIATAVHSSDPTLDRRSEFFIDPEKHYNQHQRIDRLLDMFEASASTVWKTILVILVFGAIGLILIGVKFKT